MQRRHAVKDIGPDYIALRPLHDGHGGHCESRYPPIEAWAPDTVAVVP